MLQGFLGAVTLIAATKCITFMRVPDALCIMFSSPIVTIAASAIILRDRINFSKILAGTILFSGVILVCKPPFIINLFGRLDLFVGSLKEVKDMYYVGVMLPVTSCVAGALRNVLVAKCSSVSTSVLVNWFAIAGLVLALIFCQIEDSSYILSSRITSTTWFQWVTYLGLSISGLVAFTTLTKSLHMIPPSLMSSLRCLELVLSFTVQGFISGKIPDLLSVTGGLLIIFGVIILAFQDEFQSFKDIIVKITKEKWKQNTQ